MRGKFKNPFGELKSARLNICITPSGRKQFDKLWQVHRCASRSEFIERLARRAWTIQPSDEFRHIYPQIEPANSAIFRGKKRALPIKGLRDQPENPFGEIKSARIDLCITPSGHKLLNQIWQELGCTSCSEFFECLARGLLVVCTSKRQLETEKKVQDIE